MHILPHLPLFLLTLVLASHAVLVFLDECLDGHSAVGSPPPDHLRPHLHLTTHCFTSEFCVLYSILSYNAAVLCYIACHRVEEKQSCLFSPSLSLLLSLLLSLEFFPAVPLSIRSRSLPLGSPFSSLCCSTILSLLSGPGMQLTSELSLSAGLALLMDAGLDLTIPGGAH